MVMVEAPITIMLITHQKTKLLDRQKQRDNFVTVSFLPLVGAKNVKFGLRVEIQ